MKIDMKINMKFFLFDSRGVSKRLEKKDMEV